MMKLTIRAAVLTLCIAGGAASAMVPKGTRVVSHQVNSGVPTPTCNPGDPCPLMRGK